MGFHADGLGVFGPNPCAPQHCCLSGATGCHDARRQRPRGYFDAISTENPRAEVSAAHAAHAAAEEARQAVHTAQVRRPRVPGLAAQSPKRLRAATAPVFSLMDTGPDLLPLLWRAPGRQKA